MTAARSKGLRIGLALGSGSARGWAHLGVLRALSADGIAPDLICGCSIGALVGAAALWLLQLLRGGLIEGPTAAERAAGAPVLAVVPHGIPRAR